MGEIATRSFQCPFSTVLASQRRERGPPPLYAGREIIRHGSETPAVLSNILHLFQWLKHKDTGVVVSRFEAAVQQSLILWREPLKAIVLVCRE